MAASVDIPKRRSLRLGAEGGSADVAPVTPDARAPGPRTRLSEGNQSLGSSHGSGIRSHRRVSDGARGQETSTRRRTRGHPGDGALGDKGTPVGSSSGVEGPLTEPSSGGQGPQTQPTNGAQGPKTGAFNGAKGPQTQPSSVAQGPAAGSSSKDKGLARTRFPTEIMTQSPPPPDENPIPLDAEPKRSRGGSQVSGGASQGGASSPRTGSVLGKATSSTMAEGTDHVEPGPSTVATGTVGTGPTSMTKGANHVVPGPSVVAKEPDHEEPGPSSLANEMDHKTQVTKSRSPMGATERDLEKTGPSCVRKSKKVSPPKPNTKRDHHKKGLSQVKADESAHGSLVKHGKPPPAGVASCSAFPRDHKVHCCSKTLLQEVLTVCTEIGKEVVESQQQLSLERRQLEHRNFVWDFETAFQENVSINGQSWHNAPDSDAEPDLKILEDQLDDAIIDTAIKRRRYPNKVLKHFVRGMKVERELLDLYKPVVQPQEMKLDVANEFSMMCLTDKADIVFQQISETMKALPIQLEKAEGFSQVLSLQPVLEASHLRRNIFSSRVVLEDVAKTQPKGLETTPHENAPQTKAAPPLQLKKRQSLSTPNSLYPLRSKRKISLET